MTQAPQLFSTATSTKRSRGKRESDRTLTATMLEQIRAHYVRPVTATKHGHLDDKALYPGAIVLTEVPHAETGRRIDALAIGLTRARGGLDGHEIKVSRSDWLHELDQPAKADPWFASTHRWWVVAPSTSVVQPSELPEGWGLMVPNPRGRRMKVIEKATTRSPQITWPLLLELVKKLDTQRGMAVRDAVQGVREQIRQAEQQRLQRDHDRWADHETRVGQLLATRTGMRVDDLMYALERGPDWLGPVLKDLLEASEAGYRADRGRDMSFLVDRMRSNADWQKEAAEKFNAAVSAFARTLEHTIGSQQ